MAGGATADGTAVQLSSVRMRSPQKWTSDSKGRLVGTESDRCPDSPGPSSANGTKLRIWTCAAGVNQLWKLPA
ncbi:ricin-type beta-trefoil lectin domain protein [Streptomyces sp. NPDC001292]|uniref:ricin-type beta-trefoil lectin domain protein n=1 Tax=Streptomyces sp. NPDC001292 TaxID=3364558 RepID=UPI0036AD60E3